MTIRRWHRGKLVVLWAWGVGLTGIAVTDAKTADPHQLTRFHLAEVFIAICLLVALSIVTWIWLGGKEETPITPDPRRDAQIGAAKEKL